jgi:2'-5' RNA ligase
MKIRLFIAVNLSVPVVRAVAELAEAVRRDVDETGLRVAWVPTANLHITLKFLGWSNEEAIEAIADRLRRELAARGAPSLRAHGVGAFPGPKSPRVIWVGVDDAGGALSALARDVDEWMSDLGFIKEERAFRPHLTIGRVKEGNGSVQEILDKYGDRDCGVSAVREVVVYESKLRARGAEYVARARVALGGGAGTQGRERGGPDTTRPPAEQRAKEEHDGT